MAVPPCISRRMRFGRQEELNVAKSRASSCAGDYIGGRECERTNFFSSPFASASNSMIYPEKQDSTNLSSGKAENDKRLENNRICRARAAFGGRYAPRAHAEKPWFLFSEQGSLSAKTGRISANSWEFTPRNRDRNRPCLGRPQGPRPPTVRRRRYLCVETSLGSRGRLRCGQNAGRFGVNAQSASTGSEPKLKFYVSWRRSAWRKELTISDGLANGSNRPQVDSRADSAVAS